MTAQIRWSGPRRIGGAPVLGAVNLVSLGVAWIGVALWLRPVDG